MLSKNYEFIKQDSAGKSINQEFSFLMDNKELFEYIYIFLGFLYIKIYKALI